MGINLKERPIIMLGSERSGTTLLMTMVGAHPRIAVPEVAWLYPRFRPYVHTYGDLTIESNFRTLAEEMVFGLKSPFWDMPINPTTIVDETIELAKERTFAGLYSAMFEKFSLYTGKPRWGEKTPHNLFYVEEILEDFPNAQFIYLTRDGRDSSAEYIQSSFGPTNIFAAAEIWNLCQNAVKPWRESLKNDQWLDIKYEDLVREPELILRQVCEFLNEEYNSSMLEFFKSPIAARRGTTRDHAPLGSPVSTKYIGRYKNELSINEQRVFATVAGTELAENGYAVEVEPMPLTATDISLYRERDGRNRAAVLDAPDGHVVFESYNDWIVDQREARRKAGIWSESNAPKKFPLGHPMEEEIAGHRAPRKWKDYFSIKRQYVSSGVVL